MIKHRHFGYNGFLTPQRLRLLGEYEESIREQRRASYESKSQKIQAILPGTLSLIARIKNERKMKENRKQIVKSKTKKTTDVTKLLQVNPFKIQKMIISPQENISALLNRTFSPVEEKMTFKMMAVKTINEREKSSPFLLRVIPQNIKPRPRSENTSPTRKSYYRRNNKISILKPKLVRAQSNSFTSTMQTRFIVNRSPISSPMAKPKIKRREFINLNVTTTFSSHKEPLPAMKTDSRVSAAKV